MLGRRLLLHQAGEEAVLSAIAIFLGAHAGFHGAIDHRHQLGARAFEPIHRASLDETFNHAAVHGAQVDALTKIVERSEIAAFGARFGDGIYGIRTDVLDRAEPESDSSLGTGRNGSEGELR